ncbi:MAG: carboxymuconolactone decarboxylase family protein [Gammaproteobacteria bacterium]|jgi:alkylhydroperoxidase family enzyme|nr:carboxymuconolactone decarboxylase family protein [Gammaproteobacteria bacterium]HJP36436.1 carboxymuconolactone decarboxylase family protein [Gammaproteobacteria bacterium]
MTRIPLIEPEEASGEVKAIYDRFEASGLGVLNVMKLWAHDDAFFSGFESMVNGLYADSTLDARYRELAWLRTSQVNHCHY